TRQPGLARRTDRPGPRGEPADRQPRPQAVRGGGPAGRAGPPPTAARLPAHAGRAAGSAPDRAGLWHAPSGPGAVEPAPARRYTRRTGGGGAGLLSNRPPR